MGADIVEALTAHCSCETILEIGPGHGVLTKHLLAKKDKIVFASEIDERIIEFLKSDLQMPAARILEGDFLQLNLNRLFSDEFCLIGNFPYNISSQILFKLLENKKKIPALVGMFQKEMAKRVAAKHGNKDYGVITVLVQAYYDVEYLFELAPAEFTPQPKIFSAVIRLQRKPVLPACDEKVLRHLVKTAFGQRRKMLSNALGSVEGIQDILIQNKFDKKRAEQLSIADFISLTEQMQKAK